MSQTADFLLAIEKERQPGMDSGASFFDKYLDNRKRSGYNHFEKFETQSIGLSKQWEVSE
mgnify:FL=1